MDLTFLKSGTDIRGTAIQTENEKITLTNEAVGKITKGFCAFLIEKTGNKNLRLAIGHDSRISANRIKHAIMSDIIGEKVYDCGLSTTPAMFYATKKEGLDCDGAIMITASHHPYQKNGLKFFTKAGGASSDDISKILELANVQYKRKLPKIEKAKILERYSASLVEFIKIQTGEDAPLSGLKIVLDAGNGSGGFFAGLVLEKLGAVTNGSQFLEPDGNFPNHPPNPEDRTAIKSISECVIKNKASLGIIFDTDVDRAAIVGPNGEEINRNSLIALAAASLLDRGVHIVTDSVTSDGLRDFIMARGGVHMRYKRGYQNVISKAKELVLSGINAPLAIETSGHAAFRDNDFLDDGAYLVAKILISFSKLNKQGKSLLSLISDLRQPLESIERRIYFKSDIDFLPFGSAVIKELTEYSKKHFSLEPSTYEGVRVNVEEFAGWFLLRQSVHDPNMVLNIESDKKGGAAKIEKAVIDFLSKFDNLKI